MLLEVHIILHNKVNRMATWNDYKAHVRSVNPEIGKDLDEVEAISRIVGTMIERRHGFLSPNSS